jgi:hypothetical protein
MAPQVMISLNEGVLGLYLRPDDWLTRGHCATVHLEIDCPTARNYQTGYGVECNHALRAILYYMDPEIYSLWFRACCWIAGPIPDPHTR